MFIYKISSTDEYELVLTCNGTICEWYPNEKKLISTGEAISPDELPPDNWELMPCIRIQNN